MSQDNDPILEACKQHLSEGANIEDILKFLRENNYSKLHSIMIIKELLDTTFHEARRIVHFSSIWQDRKVLDEQFEDIVFQVLDELADGEDSWLFD